MRVCQNCGKALTGNQRKFCSKECRTQTYAPNYGTPAYRPKSVRESKECANCHKPLTGRQTHYCSIACKVTANQGFYLTQSKRSLSRKLNLIARSGGKCTVCGYNRNLAALTFHHKEDKVFPLNRTMLGQRSIDYIEAEFEKCELLCANCHYTLHNPTFDMAMLIQNPVPLDLPRVEYNRVESTGLCIVCGKTLTGRQKLFCSSSCHSTYHNPFQQNYERQKQRGLLRKLELVEHFGGKCGICGYDQNLAALIFHHLDPVEKDYAMDLRSLANRSLKSVLQEFEKCQLLCENCHRELHYPELDFARLRSHDQFKNSDLKSFR